MGGASPLSPRSNGGVLPDWSVGGASPLAPRLNGGLLPDWSTHTPPDGWEGLRQTTSLSSIPFFLEILDSQSLDLLDLREFRLFESWVSWVPNIWI